MRRTKIVCTIGPATSSSVMLAKLLRAGMDVARLNFSHGTHEQHGAVFARLRELGEKRDRPLAILQDLSGPKFRLGEIEAGMVSLRRGQQITLTSREVHGNAETISLPVPELIAALRPGNRLYADDGRVEMRVVEASGQEVKVRVIVPGDLSSRKGVTAPGVPLNLPAVTEKDLDDLRFGLSMGVDWVAASYVRKPEEIAPLRAVMEEMGIRRPILAKIEKPEAVQCIEEIVAAVDGIMVARGDLGVEIPIDEVPVVQKRIIKLCNRVGKPVITATQMLDSMISNPRPTRAEVTDVANAILDGTDAVMLSGETAIGKYPVEAVRMMARIAARAEPYMPERSAFEGHLHSPANVTEAVAQATVEMARVLKAAAILCATTSGSTARLIAKYRPKTPVIGATPRIETYRRLALTWGVRPVLIGPMTDTDAMFRETLSVVTARRLVKPGDRVILTAGVPVGVIGTTNLIRVHEV
ncbi:MAG TPA: pyruvate kinase [Chthonomonadales bacterium]|nr:pyruvate kinase [Chthonomonadales bacterium]